MNTQLDIEFKKIKDQKWFPFIGDNYLTVPEDKKLLIVGESHYHDNSQPSIDKHNDQNFTRTTIQELAIDRSGGTTRIFPNFHRALFRNDKFNSSKFWNLVSFYNFVQRPMETNKRRPSGGDFYKGWLTFFDTINISKPKTCLFIGTEASQSIKRAISETDFEIVSFARDEDEKISGCYPRKATIKNANGQVIDLIFIRHTSKMFSWDKWNKYLSKTIPNELSWLEEKIVDNIT